MFMTVCQVLNRTVADRRRLSPTIADYRRLSPTVAYINFQLPQRLNPIRRANSTNIWIQVCTRHYTFTVTPIISVPFCDEKYFFCALRSWFKHHQKACWTSIFLLRILNYVCTMYATQAFRWQCPEESK
jgi:hypothetical protein